MNSQHEIRLTLKWWEVLIILAAGVLGGVGSNGGVGLLCVILAGASFGIWRCVRLLGQLLELRQAEHFGEDDQ